MSIIGIPLGLYGYIFPGNINLMVLDLYTSKKYRLLIYILSLILFFESVYCFVTLSLLETFKQNAALFKGIEVVSFILIFIMGIWMLSDTKKQSDVSHQNTLKRGIFSIIFHPQQIPFWFIMGLVFNPFMGMKFSIESSINFLVFNAIGTLFAMGIYMYFGGKILGYFKLKIGTLNRIMAYIYILISIYSLINFFMF